MLLDHAHPHLEVEALAALAQSGGLVRLRAVAHHREHVLLSLRRDAQERVHPHHLLHGVPEELGHRAVHLAEHLPVAHADALESGVGQTAEARLAVAE